MKSGLSIMGLAGVLLFTLSVTAFDYEGHRVVNSLALDALPAGFPAFVKTPAARERIAFLGGEADRWRNTRELTLKHFNSPDHFIDIEDLEDYRIAVKGLPPFRYEFVAQMAVARARFPERFPVIPSESNADRTKQLVGFLPWAIAEYHAKVKSGFSYLKAYQENGTPEEIANAQASILYVMGVLGHFVGDAAQPLHTTKHYNGWVGANPARYTTSRGFHAWIDGGYLAKTGALDDYESLKAKLHSLPRLDAPGGANRDAFVQAVEFIVQQHALVEPLYQLDKEGKLSGEGAVGREGVLFFHQQILKASQFLADLWVSAWREAPPDTYLRSKLKRREAAAQRQ